MSLIFDLFLNKEYETIKEIIFDENFVYPNDMIYQENGSKLIHFVCQNGYVDILKHLFEKKNYNNVIDINERNNTGYTGLLFACISRHFDTVNYLIKELNADINVVNSTNGMSIFHYLCINNWVDLIRYIVKNKNVDINFKNNLGLNGIHYAIGADYDEIIRFLVEETKYDLHMSDSKCKNKIKYIHVICYSDAIKIMRYIYPKKIFDLKEEGMFREKRLRAFETGLIDWPNIDTPNYKILKYFLEECRLNIEPNKKYNFKVNEYIIKHNEYTKHEKDLTNSLKIYEILLPFLKEKHIVHKILKMKKSMEHYESV